MKKKIFTLMVSLLLTLSMSITAFAAPKKMPDGTWFDAEYYAERYPDVKAAFGTDEKLLYRHYCDYGRKEGRSPYEGYPAAPNTTSDKDKNSTSKTVTYSGDLVKDIDAILSTYNDSKEFSSYTSSSKLMDDITACVNDLSYKIDKTHSFQKGDHYAHEININNGKYWVFIQTDWLEGKGGYNGAEQSFWIRINNGTKYGQYVYPTGGTRKDNGYYSKPGVYPSLTAIKEILKYLSTH